MNEEDVIIKIIQIIFALFVWAVILIVPLFSLWVLFLIVTGQLVVK